MQKDSLGRFGVNESYTNLTPEYASALEKAGYTTIWTAGSPPADLEYLDGLLAATDAIVFATGIVNIWTADARAVAQSWHRLNEKFPERFILGIGPGHPEVHSTANKPYTALVEYLDILDEEGVPSDHRTLAALGPRVLELAAKRSLGAQPYLVTPNYTREARGVVGEAALLAPGQSVVLSTDRDAGLAIGRASLRNYLGLVNYLNNFAREGFTDEDLARPGSDRFVEAIVPYGDADTIAAKIVEHLDAGADHVPIRIQVAEGEDKLPQYQELARALGLS